jgi:hypothetical protein
VLTANRPISAERFVLSHSIRMSTTITDPLIKCSIQRASLMSIPTETCRSDHGADGRQARSTDDMRFRMI